MYMYRYIWIMAAALALSGCSQEGTPPTVTGPSSSPAVKTTAPPSQGTGSPIQPAPAAPKKADEGSTSGTRDQGGPSEAPPLEAPRTGATDEGPKVKFSDKQLASIRQLPESEQAAAIRQAVCPVSGEKMGSMGKPYKVSAEGRTFYLCCDGCEDKVKADPKAVVAKLDKK
jgi:YHS domain-containing protein